MHVFTVDQTKTLALAEHANLLAERATSLAGNSTLLLREESARHAEAVLKWLGAKNVKLTIYPEANHNSWTETYKNPKVYEWLLKQSR